MAKQPDYTHVLSLIEQCQDIGKVTAFYKNAHKRGVNIVANAAHRRLKSFIPAVQEQGLEKDFWVMFSAYEDLLLSYDRPTEKLNLARDLMLNEGVIAALDHWVSQKSQVWAFEFLMTTQREHLTAEYLVLKYQAEFQSAIVEQAQKRIESLEGLKNNQKLKAA